MDSRNNSFNHNSNHRNKKRPQHFHNNSQNKKPRYNFQKPFVKSTLPILDDKQGLLNYFEAYPTLLLIGETGCGKTTQLPQYLHEKDKDLVIGITQPRRIAAITVANRVAKEMGSYLGEIVAYKVRFEDTTSSTTKIKYLTDGMLLRESMQDSLLSNYNVIILDEAHERTVNTDILFGIVKQAQKKRDVKGVKPLKIIIMSATLDPDVFTKYFDCPALYLEGREYPVHTYHAYVKQDDYIESALITIFQINEDAPPNHDMLVFLTGQDEIESMVRSIKQISKEKVGKIPLIPIPLYGSLNQNAQMKIFQKTNQGSRKVILSTNIAETSLTIPGIKYVIDTGKVKVRIYDPDFGCFKLKVENISQAQAWQRTGRAGRESSGECYRLFTEEQFFDMSPDPAPEIKRACITGVVLQLLALRINPHKFDFIEKPPDRVIDEALKELRILGAIESLTNLNLSDIGKRMSQFPIEPRFSKMILTAANDFHCVDAILSIIAILSVENIFVTPQAKIEEAKEARKKFISPYGDHLTMYNVWKCYKNELANNTNMNEWCYTNFLNRKNLEFVSNVKKQLKDICKKNYIHYKSCPEDSESILKCLVDAMPYNVAAQMQKTRKYTVLCTGQKPVIIHPSSVLFQKNEAELILFNDLEQSHNNTYIKQLSVIKPEWLNVGQQHKVNMVPKKYY